MEEDNRDEKVHIIQSYQRLKGKKKTGEILFIAWRAMRDIIGTPIRGGLQTYNARRGGARGTRLLFSREQRCKEQHGEISQSSWEKKWASKETTAPDGL